MTSKLRVLRLLEYEYDTAAHMVRDMTSWNLMASRVVPGLTIHSAVLPAVLKESFALPMLEAAAEAVCEFDWSDNDADAVAAIEKLRQALQAAKETP